MPFSRISQTVSITRIVSLCQYINGGLAPMSSHASANSSLRQYGRPFQNHVHESQISSLPNQRQHCRSSSGKRRTYPQSVSYLYERTHVSFALKEQPLPFGCPNDLPEQSAQHMNQSHL